MAQEYYTINDKKIKQPLELMPFQFATTYTEDTTRTQDGKMHSTPLFTVESFSYSAKGLTAKEMSQFLQLVGKGKIFNFHYFSPYYGVWRTDKFYVGQGSLQIRRVNEKAEHFDGVSCNIIGVNPI